MTTPGGRRPVFEGVLGALGGLVSALVYVAPGLSDPITSEEASGVRGGPWTDLLVGWDAPTNPPILLWAANGLADGVAVVDVGRAIAFLGTLVGCAVVGWTIGRRGGWTLGVLAGAVMAWMPPLVLDGARVRGYGPSVALLALHTLAWLRLAEGDDRPGVRALRVLTGGLAVYAHYLTAPLLVLHAAAWWSVGDRGRRHPRDLGAIGLMWAPTAVWLLGDGNPPRDAREPFDRVLWYVLGFSAQRAPLSWPVLMNLWRESWAVLWVPAALLLAGPLADARAVALRRAAVLQLGALVLLGTQWLVRAPAAALVLPATVGAIALGIAAAPRWRGALVAVPFALWAASGWRHAVARDPFLRMADADEAVAWMTDPARSDRTLYVPDRSEFVRMDLLVHGVPHDAPSRGPALAPCVPTPGATLCRGQPPAGEAFFRPWSANQALPRGCTAEVRGRGWVVMACEAR